MANVHNAKNDSTILGDIAIGAIAGAVGVWAMDRVGWFMYNREDSDALQQEQEARKGSMDVAHTAVAKASHHLGFSIEPKQPNAAGIGFHYMLGILPGALYGVLWNRYRPARTNYGALYGLILFLAQDEAVAPLLGIASKPGKYPRQAHIRGLVSHLILGVATDITIRGLNKARRKYNAK